MTHAPAGVAPARADSPDRAWTRKVRAHGTQTPTVLQMTAVECGAACLGMVLAHFGRTVPLSTLRVRCAVDRDGASALAIIRAARTFELEPKAQLVSLWQLTQIALPAIAFWYEAHFVVIEAVAPRGIRVNDPSSGRRWVTWEEADRAVSGVVVEFHKGPQFKPGGQRTTTRSFIMSWMSGSWSAVHFAVALGLCGALMAVLVPLLSREYANGVLQQGNPNNAFPLALATMASAVLLGLITFGQKLALVRLMVKLADQSARNLMHNMLLAPLTFFSSRPAGDLAGRVMLTSQVSQVLAYQLAPALLALLTIAICLLVLAILVGWLLAALAVLAVLAEISALYAVQRSRVARSRQVAAARLGYLAAATQTMRSMELLKSSGYESAAFTDVTGLQAKASNAFQDLQRPALVVGPIPTMVSKLASVILLVGGALLIFDGETTVGTIIAALSLLAGALAPGQTLVQVGQALQTLPGDLERISDAMKSSQPPAQCRETVSMGGRIQGRLQLKDVTFGYSPDQPILRSIDLSVNPGEHVALVGATGSGKTTLGRLILGLLEPWEGQVLIDDVDRTQIPAHELRADLAGVDQAIVLFSGTIRDNLTLWDPTVPDAVLDSASEDADILKVIIGRGGYDAPVNHDGENFSGGERQRLELARALASDPAILVLDEATSALDPIASRKIGRSLKARGCTTFTIAHRLGSIRDSDQILVLVKGQIVERGTHNELMAQRAYYYDLVAEDNARRGSE